ncbi:hypothetical protein B0J11DRAFT_130171 [Dendryphion nanum]|uniref:Uncharacterized protein n=1 Tax=Dendryphion nanum TaxID=256645 RepID=A0A9P9IAI1_9PLEO|nr:hypothetical protein B0J11DRAFT_130171 [Dendryphion nanum]
MDTLTSWAIFIAIAAAGWWYYTRNSNSSPQRGRPLQRSANNNLDWIESETKAKVNAAVKTTKAKTAGPRKTAKKAVQDIGEKIEASVSGASSAAGADADDDLSPVTSPAPTSGAATKGPSGRDVSDMLEPQAAAPKVMSIKASEKPARQAKPQQQRSESQQETKKQRQNRKKTEEAKAQRQAEELERKKLEENQRRTAREARHEPAKNGLQSAQAPDSNAWVTAGSKKKAPAPAPAVVAQAQLLDTFEPEVSTSKTSLPNTNRTAPASGNAGWNGLPSEEEQIRLALEDSAWTTVAKPKKQRKTKAAGEEDGSDSGVPQEATPVQAPVKTSIHKNNTKHVENVQPTLKSRYGLLEEPTDKTHEQDSDWPVV